MLGYGRHNQIQVANRTSTTSALAPQSSCIHSDRLGDIQNFQLRDELERTRESLAALCKRPH